MKRLKQQCVLLPLRQSSSAASWDTTFRKNIQSIDVVALERWVVGRDVEWMTWQGINVMTRGSKRWDKVRCDIMQHYKIRLQQSNFLSHGYGFQFLLLLYCSCYHYCRWSIQKWHDSWLHHTCSLGLSSSLLIIDR